MVAVGVVDQHAVRMGEQPQTPGHIFLYGGYLVVECLVAYVAEGVGTLQLRQRGETV